MEIKIERTTSRDAVFMLDSYSIACLAYPLIIVVDEYDVDRDVYNKVSKRCILAVTVSSG